MTNGMNFESNYCAEHIRRSSISKIDTHQFCQMLQPLAGPRDHTHSHQIREIRACQSQRDGCETFARNTTNKQRKNELKSNDREIQCLYAFIIYY